MLVIIPTYKRLDTLKWVLVSILNNKLPILDNKPKLLIVNNYYPNKEKVLTIIKDIEKNVGCENWEILQINREKTLPPVENWFSAVRDFALDNEIVFFVGDDDPLTRTSLFDRYAAMMSSNSDFVLSRINHGLFFNENANKIYFNGEIAADNYQLHELKCEDFWGWTAIHLSNHCFKYNDIFKKALSLSFHWCDQQDYVNESDRRLFITYYLTLGIYKSGGKIIGLDKKTSFRGMSLDEVRNSKYGVKSWNLGYISGLAYELLRRNDFVDLKLNRQLDHFFDIFKKYYLLIYLDERVNRSELKELCKRINFKIHHLSLSDVLYSLQKYMLFVLRLQGIRLYYKLKFFGVPTTDFIKSIKGEH